MISSIAIGVMTCQIQIDYILPVRLNLTLRKTQISWSPWIVAMPPNHVTLEILFPQNTCWSLTGICTFIHLYIEPIYMYIYIWLPLQILNESLSKPTCYHLYYDHEYKDTIYSFCKEVYC